jgi:RNA 3'-terminal phosphate cyclase (ATP)
MLTIDGSFGEGGGQIVRSSLALALVTGREVVIEHVRAKRKKPGLMRQHLTAVKAAAQIGRAAIEGAEIGSTWLRFAPREVRPGEYHFDVGSAGSTGLVLETILPALLTAGGPSRVVLEGGTHNPLAPPFEFLTHCLLPLVERIGPRVTAVLERPGFYPAGGGRVSVEIQPAERLAGLELLERGPILDQQVRAVVANLPRHIAERECRTIAVESGWDSRYFTVEEARNSRGPGNVVLIALESQYVTEVFAGFGQRGVPAERVAQTAWREAADYERAEVPVGPHLADQLMLPLALAAGLHGARSEFRTMPLTLHSTTHLALVQRFLDLTAEVDTGPDGNCTVRLGPGTVER